MNPIYTSFGLDGVSEVYHIGLAWRAGLRLQYSVIVRGREKYVTTICFFSLASAIEFARLSSDINGGAFQGVHG